MDRNVLVEVTTTNSYEDGSSDTTRINAGGTFGELDGKKLIKYIENDVTNIIKVEGQVITITRKSSELNSRLVCDKNSDTSMVYETIYGGMPMVIHTEELVVVESEGCLIIKLVYVISMNDRSLSTNSVNIKVRSN